MRLSSHLARIDVAAAVYAGIAAGIAATVVQVVLWAALPTHGRRSFSGTRALPQRSSLAAASCRRRPVSTGGSWRWRRWCISRWPSAGLVLATLIAGPRAPKALITGAAFGLILYAVNMYGFTVIFPWFAASRDWITAAAHAAFGIAAAGAYRLAAGVRQRRARR